ncbi:alpha/beta hydrolase [Candidatus Micrarchaeota archaeon]|nr:alpha/beta hydrolase [Candidatus Micrarchaeota archaeon]
MLARVVPPRARLTTPDIRLHEETIEGTRSGSVHYKFSNSHPPQRTVVLLSGWTCTPFPLWGPVVDRLAPKANVLLVENRGHGRSSIGSSNSVTYLNDVTDDVQRAMDHAKIERALIITHSMTELVARRLHQTTPERMTGRISVSGVFGNPLESWTLGNSGIIGTAARMISAGLATTPGADLVKGTIAEIVLAQRIIKRLVRTMLGPEIHPELFGEFMRATGNVPIEVIDIALRAMLREPAITEEHDYTVPTLYIAGRNDPLVCPDKIRVNGELVVLDHVRHAAQLEDPRTVVRHIEEFAQKHGIFE